DQRRTEHGSSSCGKRTSGWPCFTVRGPPVARPIRRRFSRQEKNLARKSGPRPTSIDRRWSLIGTCGGRSVRLTLRTLLAYLDDPLEAGEIKPIGQKVAESAAAQELIARIRQVTRRRRLTVPPPTGPNGVDPNDVAEYLDNCLSNEQIAEFEK